ncbi:MAG: glycosyltransferase family 1 protein [Kiritimatiellae bacterium]|jgi:glycosyltransferase involved in cell wall biosynthesis|nr:glycosyltransferase family 1 protein [Kiritimatiellia bacterium]
MKIAVDARWIFPETSGIGQHTKLLIRELSQLKTEHFFLLLFDDEERARAIKEETDCRWQHEVLPYGLFSIQNQLKLGGWLRQQQVDLYHSTNYMMPLWRFPRHRAGAVKAVITIHDLIPMVYRDHAPKSRKSQLYPVYAWLMRQVAARADRIITVSESSARDVKAYLSISKHRLRDKLRVVYNGLDPVFHESHEVPRHDPPEILYVGRLDPYKNVPQLVSAFSEAIRRLPPGTRLRIIGPPDERYPEAMALARQMDLFPRMDWEGHVEFETLVEAYRRATVVVLPSEYEGFGLPVAEGMACGTPVICSEASSLPEVGGDAARYVSPGDLFGLAEALIEVVTDKPLRDRMIQKGLEQAKRFQGKIMAEETLKVYEDVLRGKDNQTVL